VAMCLWALVVKGQRVTVLQFVLVVWLHLVLGFSTFMHVGARLRRKGCILVIQRQQV
jgi:hypothetical protein